jgi:pimeloyl-ACP methyl ester carboxylesterase
MALLLLLGVVYPRLRAGLRGGLALFVGLVGLGSGIGVAVVHSIEESPSGDDFTGIVAALAGAVLAALGFVALWRSRRLDENKRRRYVRRGVITVAAVFFGGQLVFGTAFGYVITHRVRSSVHQTPLGRPHQDVSFTTSDGLELHGWYVPSRNRAAVIVFPGRGGNPAAHARMLAGHGYGALLFDNRGHGVSDGDANVLGWGGEPDVRAAIDFLSRRTDVDPRRIGGLGLSVGGELMLQAAAHTKALHAVVSEGAGARSYKEDWETNGPAKWIAAPFTISSMIATAVFSNSLPPEKLHDLVAKIAPRPVFFIFATHGQGGEDMNPQYYALAGEPKELWEIGDAKHVGGLAARPAEYERRVIAFFDRALLPNG